MYLQPSVPTVGTLLIPDTWNYIALHLIGSSNIIACPLLLPYRLIEGCIVQARAVMIPAAESCIATKIEVCAITNQTLATGADVHA